MRIFPESPSTVSIVSHKPSPDKPAYPSWRLIITSTIAVLTGGFHFGFHIAIVNPLAEVLQQFLTTTFERRYGMPISDSALQWMWSALAGCLFIGATIGASIGSMTVRSYGAAKSILASAVLLSMSIFLSGFAYVISSCELFVLCRLLTGVGIGLGTTAHGVFLAEISPVEHRGFISSFGGFSTNVGFIIACVLGLPQVLGSVDLWHFAYFIGVIPCMLAIFHFTLFADESPVFLMRKGDEEGALRSVSVYCPYSSSSSVLADIRSELSNCTEDSLASIVKSPVSRRALLLSVLLNVVVSFSGIVAISFFGTFLLHSLGFSQSSAAVANCLSSMSSTVGAVTATLTVDKIGRRVLVVCSLLSLALMNALMLVLVLVYDLTMWSWLGWLFLVLFTEFHFLFSAGAGPAAWFIGAELAPASSRSTIQALSISSQYITCAVCPSIYYPLQRSIGAFSFILFILPLSLSSVYFYRCLPETKGKTSEEISEALRGQLRSPSRGSQENGSS